MSKIIIENKSLDGIPVNEFYIDDQVHKGLVFVQHGYRSNKERGADDLAIKIARKGFFVVALDAYMHGERKAGPFIQGDETERLYYIPSIIRKTALDIIKLHKKYYNNFLKFDLVGISLGGMIAYYTSVISHNIRLLVPVISTPKVTKQALKVLKDNGVNPDEYFTNETYGYLQQVDPFNHVEKFTFEKMFILNGKLDNVVSTQDSIDYYNEYKTDYVIMNLYDVKHEVTKDMQYDIVDFLCNEKRT